VLHWHRQHYHHQNRKSVKKREKEKMNYSCAYKKKEEERDRRDLGVSFYMHEIFQYEPSLDTPELINTRGIIANITLKFCTGQMNENSGKPSGTFEIVLYELKPYIFIC
jgi:hypothetical protein